MIWCDATIGNYEVIFRAVVWMRGQTMNGRNVVYGDLLLGEISYKFAIAEKM